MDASTLTGVDAGGAIVRVASVILTPIGARLGSVPIASIRRAALELIVPNTLCIARIAPIAIARLLVE